MTKEQEEMVRFLIMNCFCELRGFKSGVKASLVVGKRSGLAVHFSATYKQNSSSLP